MLIKIWCLMTNWAILHKDKTSFGAKCITFSMRARKWAAQKLRRIVVDVTAVSLKIKNGHCWNKCPLGQERTYHQKTKDHQKTKETTVICLSNNIDFSVWKSYLADRRLVKANEPFHSKTSSPQTIFSPVPCELDRTSKLDHQRTLHCTQ